MPIIAAFAALAFASCVSAPSPALAPAERVAAQRVITVQAFAGDVTGQLANSYLIAGSVDAILIDAQLDPKNALRLSEQIKASGKVLKEIFITHAHPDHFRGLETLLKAFPGARAVSTRSVSEEIRKSGIDRRFVPQPLADPELVIEHEKARVIELGEPGESAAAALVVLPSSRTLLCGDVAFNGVHPRLGDASPEEWLEALESLRQIAASSRIEKVLPGHGPAGDARLIEETHRYLEALIAATLAPATPAQAVARMEGFYPGHRLRANLEASVRARLGNPSSQGR